MCIHPVLVFRVPAPAPVPVPEGEPPAVPGKPSMNAVIATNVILN